VTVVDNDNEPPESLAELLLAALAFLTDAANRSKRQALLDGGESDPEHLACTCAHVKLLMALSMVTGDDMKTLQQDADELLKEWEAYEANLTQ
jgi:hypothetical protein